jgi:hypothetical protein
VALPLLFYFLCAEFFSTLGTLIGVTGAASLRRADGSIPNATAAFATDATASIVGALHGTSVTAYIEFIAGVQASGSMLLDAPEGHPGGVALPRFAWAEFADVGERFRLRPMQVRMGRLFFAHDICG